MLLAIIAVGLSVMGLSYAAWTDNLSILGNVTFGNFTMSFQENSGQYKVQIVDSMSLTAQNIESIECETRIGRDGRTAELFFGRGLPLNLLMEGRYLQITYPITPADGSVTPAALQAGGTDATRRTVDFTPAESLMVIDHIGYMAPQWTEGFAIPLSFELHPAINNHSSGQNRAQNQGDAEGIVWLALSAESIAAVSSLPDMMEIPYSLLDEAECVPVQDNDNGIRVTYRCTIPVMIEQTSSQ